MGRLFDKIDGEKFKGIGFLLFGIFGRLNRLIRRFPTDPDRAAAWPDGCRNDRAVLARMTSTYETGSFVEGYWKVVPMSAAGVEQAKAPPALIRVRRP